MLGVCVCQLCEDMPTPLMMLHLFPSRIPLLPALRTRVCLYGISELQVHLIVYAQMITMTATVGALHPLFLWPPACLLCCVPYISGKLELVLLVVNCCIWYRVGKCFLAIALEIFPPGIYVDMLVMLNGVWGMKLLTAFQWIALRLCVHVQLMAKTSFWWSRTLPYKKYSNWNGEAWLY